MTKFLRVKDEIIDVKCNVATMRLFVFFAVSSVLLDVVLFVEEGVCF